MEIEYSNEVNTIPAENVDFGELCEVHLYSDEYDDECFILMRLHCLTKCAYGGTSEYDKFNINSTGVFDGVRKFEETNIPFVDLEHGNIMYLPRDCKVTPMHQIAPMKIGNN